MSKNESIYQMVTDRIIEKLEQGVVPWQKPWSGGGLPKNLISGKQYRGINTFILACQSYNSPYWLTYKQAQDRGGNVRKGEKGTTVIFWKFLDTKETQENGEVKNKKVPMLRYYTVFNSEQCDGIQVEEEQNNSGFAPIAKCEEIVNGWEDRPTIEHEEQQAYYRPSTDTINMPKPTSFVGEQEYYSTLFHEMTHSTGHKSRLDRLTESANFGSKEYSKEELVAEMGAAMLCGVAGIENKTIDNSASYINSWLKVLRADCKLLVSAGGQAQKAADMILGVSHE